MIEIAEYDPQWPIAFEELHSVFQSALGSLVLAVEHVGSTAVPNLAAKPIIDIDIVIESIDLLPAVTHTLGVLGYLHQGDLGIRGREAFVRTGRSAPLTGTDKIWPDHHLYVCPKDSPELKRHLALRDYLRANSDQVTAYSRLKRHLARQFAEDRGAYTKAKTEFIESIYRKVL